MSTSEAQERLWVETLKLAEALKDHPSAEPGSKPQPGEIYLSHRTANFPVEWLVLATEGKKIRVVPVDDFPLVGRTDVELSRNSLKGVAIARCGHPAWAPAIAVEPSLRTAVLAAAELDKIRK